MIWNKIWLNVSNLFQIQLNIKMFGIQNLEIKAKRYLSGNFEITELSSEDSSCDNLLGHENEIYRILEIKHDFEDDSTEEVIMEIIINESWINGKNISEIKTYRCSSKNEMLETGLLNSEKSLYQIKSQGFSTWVIFGVKEEIVEEKEFIDGVEEDIIEIENILHSYNQEIISTLIILVLIWLLFIDKKKGDKKKGKKKSKRKSHK